MLRRDFVELSTKLAVARVLGLAQPHAGRVLDAARRLRERSHTLASPYLDAHAHSASGLLLAYRAVSGGPPQRESPADGATLIRHMDAVGVRRAFVLSTAYQMAADAYGTRTSETAEYARVRFENDFTAAECAQFPTRLMPFLSLNPKRDYAVEEVDRCAEQKMRGLKLHLWNSLVDTRQAAELASVRRVVERAAHHRLPIVAHILVGAVPNYGPDDTERFVREIIMPFDTLQISLAHLAAAGGFGMQQQACFQRLIALCGPDTPYASRVWTDMAAVLTATTPADDARRLGDLLPRWGLDRILWGSDNIEDALALTRAQWPLDATAWQAIADQRGTALVAA
ncbi:MAG: amidohydrolase [Gemmatimonadota bacterium]|nr:amidohydrolase [Gemmatimonadota bacterium]